MNASTAFLFKLLDNSPTISVWKQDRYNFNIKYLYKARLLNNKGQYVNIEILPFVFNNDSMVIFVKPKISVQFELQTL